MGKHNVSSLYQIEELQKCHRDSAAPCPCAIFFVPLSVTGTQPLVLYPLHKVFLENVYSLHGLFNLLTDTVQALTNFIINLEKPQYKKLYYQS